MLGLRLTVGEDQVGFRRLKADFGTSEAWTPSLLQGGSAGTCHTNFIRPLKRLIRVYDLAWILIFVGAGCGFTLSSRHNIFRLI